MAEEVLPVSALKRPEVVDQFGRVDLLHWKTLVTLPSKLLLVHLDKRQQKAVAGRLREITPCAGYAALWALQRGRRDMDMDAHADANLDRQLIGILATMRLQHEDPFV